MLKCREGVFRVIAAGATVANDDHGISFSVFDAALVKRR
jgi:hypothetical protein